MALARLNARRQQDHVDALRPLLTRLDEATSESDVFAVHTSVVQLGLPPKLNHRSRACLAMGGTDTKRWRPARAQLRGVLQDFVRELAPSPSGDENVGATTARRPNTRRLSASSGDYNARPAPAPAPPPPPPPRPAEDGEWFDDND